MARTQAQAEDKRNLEAAVVTELIQLYCMTSIRVDLRMLNICVLNAKLWMPTLKVEFVNAPSWPLRPSVLTVRFTATRLKSGRLSVRSCAMPDPASSSSILSWLSTICGWNSWKNGPLRKRTGKDKVGRISLYWQQWYVDRALYTCIGW